MAETTVKLPILRRVRVAIRASTAVTLSSVARGGWPEKALRPKGETLDACAGRLLDNLAMKIREYDARFQSLAFEPDFPTDPVAAIKAAREVAAIGCELLPIVGSDYLRCTELIQSIQYLEKLLAPRSEIPVLIEWAETAGGL